MGSSCKHQIHEENWLGWEKDYALRKVKGNELPSPIYEWIKRGRGRLKMTNDQEGYQHRSLKKYDLMIE